MLRPELLNWSVFIKRILGEATRTLVQLQSGLTQQSPQPHLLGVSGDIHGELGQNTQNWWGAVKAGGLEETPSLLTTNPVWTTPVCCYFHL